MKLTESEVQSLKAQEAKDLAVELLRKLEAKERGPISAGEVQLQELQYELKLKEAEAEDNRLRESHAQRIKELELEIEQEKTRQAEAARQADELRRKYAELVERVQSSQESLGIQLETATREHAVKMETLQQEHDRTRESYGQERERLEGEKNVLIERIQALTELSEVAEDVERLREEIESRKAAQQRELQQLDENFATAEFEKNKAVNQLRRDQDLAVAELESQHKKQVMQMDMDAASAILEATGLMSIEKPRWEELQRQLEQQRQVEESAHGEIRRQAEAELKKTYNITSDEVLDVTQLFYERKSLAEEVSRMRDQIGKFEAEITRMRKHIEDEPERISKAVEAAKVNVQNRIEQASGR